MSLTIPGWSPRTKIPRFTLLPHTLVALRGAVKRGAEALQGKPLPLPVRQVGGSPLLEVNVGLGKGAKRHRAVRGKRYLDHKLENLRMQMAATRGWKWFGFIGGGG